MFKVDIQGRNPERISVLLNHLQKVWEMAPQLRFGQLIYNIFHSLGKDNIEAALYEYEDGLWNHIFERMNLSAPEIFFSNEDELKVWSREYFDSKETNI